jgi:Tfp pilus assembly protein PilN
MIVYRAAGVFVDEGAVECRWWGRTLKGAAVPLGRWHKPLPAGEDTAFFDAWSEAAADLKTALRPRPDRLVLVVPPWETLVFRLTLPRSARPYVLQAVGYELERHVPWTAQETLYAVDAVSAVEDGMLDVLVGAVLKERLDRYLEPLEAAGLSPHLVLTMTQAVHRAACRAFGEPFPEEDMVLGQPTRAGWHLVAYLRGKPIHAGFVTAAPGEETDRDRWVERALAFGDEVGVEPRRVLDGTVVADPADASPGAEEAKSESADTPADDALELPDAASGAALAGLDLEADALSNLLPREKRRRPARWPVALAALLVLTFLGLALSLPYARVVRLEKQSRGLEKVLSEKKRQLARIEKLRRENEQLKERIQWLSRLQPPADFFALLESLTETIPPPAWVRSLSWRGDTLVLSGDAPSSADLLGVLSKSPYLKNVQFVSSTRRRADLETFRFKAEVVEPSRDEAEKE